MSDRHVPVAIIGGGFSGTMIAAHLARRNIASVLIEGGDRAGKGIAYSTRDPAHLLNVRAGNMSAWPDDPFDFMRFAQDDGAGPDGFAQRRIFGDYLGDILREATSGGKCRLIERSAVSAQLTDGKWAVRLDDGSELCSRALVLATGNQPPQPVSDRSSSTERLIANPWGAQARDAIRSAARERAHVLILGTGLTMVDVVLSLDSAGHRAPIVALSRRGLVPRGHSIGSAAGNDQPSPPVGGLMAVWRWVRDQAGTGDWRSAIDRIRPFSHQIWQSLDKREKARFLRHARPWWDVHRHRIAPQVAARLAEMIESGRLRILAGRIARLEDSPAEIVLTYVPRGRSDAQTLSSGFAFNCTGPLGSITKTNDPLVRQLLAGKGARGDELGIGLEVDDRSRVQGSERLWAVGPLTKGRYWEIIAVPDIRGQVADVADDIARELGQ